jgi:hypothetical protein
MSSRLVIRADDDGPGGRLVLVVDDTLAIVLEVIVRSKRSGTAFAGQEVTIIEIRSAEQ